MECDICYKTWDNNKHTPRYYLFLLRILGCGHTFCEACLLSILSKNGNFITCQSCKTIFKNLKKEKDIKNLIKNFNLIRIVEKIDTRRSTISNVSLNITKLNSELTELDEDKKVLIDSYNEYSHSRYVFCKKHHNVVHSVALGTNLAICDKCIEENCFAAEPLPSLVKDLKTKINSSLNLVELYDNEIDRLRDFFNSYQDEFYNTNKQKIETLFSYLHKILMNNYNTAIQILNQCKSEQFSQIEGRISELSNLKEELRNIHHSLVDLDRITDEGELMKNVTNISKINKKMNYFLNYELELNLLSLKIGLNENYNENLFQAIQNSYHVDIEFTNINGEVPSLKHILQKDIFWTCSCGEIVS